VLAGLGLAEEAPSPSYPIVIAYDVPELRLPLWHVDLYRIEDAGELDELGLDEVRDEVAMLIEWPERMGDGLWAGALHLTLQDAPDGGRRLTWKAPPAWKERWPPARI
jgi:tRNA threonylcarbamoyladenosine biosynthesis protein TsaE